RRDIAITIPAGRAAHVFVADPGVVRLDDLRVSLVPVSAQFDPGAPLALATESVIAELRMSGRTFPAAARALLPEAAEHDLGFGIAVAHLLWRCQDRAAFATILQRLAHHRQLPDVAILEQLEWATPSGPEAAPPAADRRDGEVGLAPVVLDAPPLFRASLAMLMIRPELDSRGIPPSSALAQAARTSFHDSIWCTWSARPWDERWIEPAIESLRKQDRDRDAASLARGLALPTQTVEEVLRRLDGTTTLVRHRRRLDTGEASVPGYVFEEVLDRGVQSTVFRAKRQDGRRIALKIVRLRGGAAHCARVLRRLALVERTGHPAFVEPRAWGALPGDAGIWLETELCEGSLLDLVSETDTPLPVPEAYAKLLEASAILAHLHDRKLPHGDLKPGNLLVLDDGRLAIADRWLAQCLMHPGAAPDTPRFAPPEVLAGAEPSLPASDVWSLAATFYFLLTLELPRDEYAEQSQLDAALANPIVPLAVRRPDLPPSLARCLDRALSPMIDRRPRDGAALHEALLQAELSASSDVDGRRHVARPAPAPPLPAVLPRAELRRHPDRRLAAGSELALEPLLDEELALLVEATGASFAYLELYDDHLWPRYRRESRSGGAVGSSVSREIIAQAVAECRTIETLRAGGEDRFADLGSSRAPAAQAVLCTPIGAGPPIGVIYFQGRTRPGLFTAADRDRVEAFARQLAPLAHRLVLRDAADRPRPPPPQLARGSEPPPRTVELAHGTGEQPLPHPLEAPRPPARTRAERVIRSVLVVDDDEHILAAFRRELGRTHTVLATPYPSAARSLVRTEFCDLAIIDLRLKGESGIALTRDLKRMRPDLLVALYSGYLSVEIAVGAVQAGADLVLFKPVTAREILTRIEQEPEPNAADTPNLEHAKWEHITQVIADCNSDLSQAARRLGVDPSALRRRLRRADPPPLPRTSPERI
ncbi:MAG TPA: response regulator, partial [Kofleriaceae bacterium]|nr:response regulator [Kofleriaceae bacterium]